MLGWLLMLNWSPAQIAAQKPKNGRPSEWPIWLPEVDPKITRQCRTDSWLQGWNMSTKFWRSSPLDMRLGWCPHHSHLAVPFLNGAVLTKVGGMQKVRTQFFNAVAFFVPTYSNPFSTGHIACQVGSNLICTQEMGAKFVWERISSVFRPHFPAAMWRVTNVHPAFGSAVPRFRCQWLALYGAWPGVPAQRWPSSELWRSEHGLFDDGWPVGQRHLNAPSATEHWLEPQWKVRVIHDDYDYDYKEQWMNWWSLMIDEQMMMCNHEAHCLLSYVEFRGHVDISPLVVRNHLTPWWIC